MLYTYSGTITNLHGGIYRIVPGTIRPDGRADFRHVSGDPDRYLQHASLDNMLPVGVF